MVTTAMEVRVDSMSVIQHVLMDLRRKCRKMSNDNSSLINELELTKRMYAKVCEEKCKADAENARLRELILTLADCVSKDRCEGCVYKSRWNDGLADECWHRSETHEMAERFGDDMHDA